MKLLIILLFSISCSKLSIKKSKNHIVIAHRGASGYLPEHTLESASLAHGFNVDYIEPDIVMTKDNKLVILHDHHLDTTTNVATVYPNKKRKDGRFYAIDFTLKQIKKLKVKERTKIDTNKRYFEKRFPENQSHFEVPTLEEFIELIQGLNKSRKKDIGIYPEIKKPEFHLKEGKDITKKVIQVLRKYGYEKKGKIYIQCFYPNTLKRLKNEFKTNIPLVQLIADNSWKESSANYQQMLSRKGIEEIATYANGIGPWIPQVINVSNPHEVSVTPLVKYAHALGLTVHPYTHRLEQIPPQFENNKKFLDYLFNEALIDGIFSDFSDNVVHYLGR